MYPSPEIVPLEESGAKRRTEESGQCEQDGTGQLEWGMGLVLANAFALAVGTHLDMRAWMRAVALVIAGIASIPVSVHLYQRSLKRSILDPLRSFVLAMLSGES